jgi:ATP-binding protein involved in chromosome partitioning
MSCQTLTPFTVKKIIAVASGKGGVGKSTTALNMALSLSTMNYKVGLLDLDLFGPSLPCLLGVFEKPSITEDKKFSPIDVHGIKTMSLGYLVDPSQAAIWRGPMAQTAVSQLIKDVLWGDLDFLIIDLPPGTSDIHLTLCQKVHLSGAVIVSTPQDLALLDVKKGIAFFDKLNVRVLGMIENMSSIECPNCLHTFHPFSTQGAKKLAHQENIPYLGDVPLSMSLRKSCDDGKPAFFEDDSIKNNYDSIVLNLLKTLNL